jgi:hypothetical protein
MALTYLHLCNRVLKALNDPELDSSVFANAVGFDAEVKDSINNAILDIYHEEELSWPWAHSEQTFTTTIGQTRYTPPSIADKIDWDSFQIEVAAISVTSLTSTGTTATATTSAAHNFVAGDIVRLLGATPDGYNGTITIVSAPTSVTFTYTVASGLTTPATGTITVRPTYEASALIQLNYNTWLSRDKQEDDKREPTDYQTPEYVVRARDNSIILTPSPDKAYVIRYDAYAYPTKLVDHDDVTEIPDEYEQLIVDRAMYYAYRFRDNYEMVNESKDKYKRHIHSVRNAVISRQPYFRIGN